MTYSRTAAIAAASHAVRTSKQGRGHIVICPATTMLDGPSLHSMEMPWTESRFRATVAKARVACELMGLSWDATVQAMYNVESGKCDWRQAVKIAATVKHGPNGNATADCLCNACTAGIGDSHN